MKNIITVLLFSIIASACAHTPATPIARNLDGEIIHELKDGNIRFKSHQRINPRQDNQRVQELSTGQAPSTVVVSCSDSRVPPEMVFDQGLGDIFSVRTAGHALDSISIASIEYAVQHLGSKVILIMGHTSCGAIKASVTSGKNPNSGSKNIDQLIKAIKPGIKTMNYSDSELVDAAKENVEASIVLLKSKSPLIRDQIKQGKIKIVGALYYLKSGEIELW